MPRPRTRRHRSGTVVKVSTLKHIRKQNRGYDDRVGKAYNYEESTKAHQACTKNGNRPMDFVVCRPAIEEQASSHERTKLDHEKKTILRPGLLHAISFHACGLNVTVQQVEKHHANH